MYKGLCKCYKALSHLMVKEKTRMHNWKCENTLLNYYMIKKRKEKNYKIWEKKKVVCSRKYIDLKTKM